MTRAEPHLRVWLCRARDWSAAAAENAYLSWLDQEERERWRAFVQPHDRHVYLLAHGMLRRALSAVSREVHPSDWRFQSGLHGKPSVLAPGAKRELSFSLSHTKGWAGIAIGRGRSVGIDLEAMRPDGDRALAAAAAEYAPEERSWLGQSKLSGRALPILRLWTLKEAYAKARGLGLHLPFRSFSFSLAPRRGVCSFRPPASDDGESWRFLELGYNACRAAIAFDARGGGVSPCVQIEEAAPHGRRRRRLIMRRGPRGEWRCADGKSVAEMPGVR